MIFCEYEFDQVECLDLPIANELYISLKIRKKQLGKKSPQQKLNLVFQYPSN